MFLLSLFQKCVRLIGGLPGEESHEAIGKIQQVADPQETRQDEIGRSGTVSLLALNETKDLTSRLGSLEQEVVTTKVVLEELFSLLEEYGPTWYTEEHHKRAVAALLAQGTRSVCDTYRLGMTN